MSKSSIARRLQLHRVQSVGERLLALLRRCPGNARNLRFLRALFQFRQGAAGKAAKFGRGGVEFLGVVGAARLERGEPAAEAGELIRRQLGDCFGDFFDFHAAQYTRLGRVAA